MPSKRIVFIGTVDFSAHCLKCLFGLKANIVGIFAKKQSSFNADFVDLWPLAKEKNIPIYEVEDINSPLSIKQMKSLSPDVIFCFGWSHLLKEEVLALAPLGVIGAHPAALPSNRGRHPLIWAVALGLPSSALTFFKMDRGADTGPIVAQARFAIDYREDAASLYRKIKNLATKLLGQLMRDLNDGRLQIRVQKKSMGNDWRKRGFADGQIDWRMSSRAIYNLVRALTKPYIGAHFMIHGQPVKVFKVREKIYRKNNIEPGKVLAVKNNRMVVKTYDGAIELVEHDCNVFPKVGDYLI